MRVGIDGRVLRAGKPRRGVAVYLEAMLRELVRAFPEDEYSVLVPRGARDGAVPAGVRVVSPRAPGRALFGAAAITGRPRLDLLLESPDVVWVPAVAPLAVSPGVPLVLTVHDLSFEHRPRDYTAYERLWHRLARPRGLARRAGRVIAVSGTVREELVAEWHLPEDAVATVQSGPGRPVAAGGSPPAGVPPAYVLAVGALEPRKLPGLLGAAHAAARERGLEAALVFAGDGPARPDLERSGALVLDGLGDAELDALYEGALCLACVSREEGFGFTPLEALARGVPPVVSELPVFQELLGDAALRVPAGSRDGLADALLRLERDPALREELLSAGRDRLAAISWERAARATRAVLAEAAG